MRHSKDTRLDELQPAHGENKIPCKARRQLRRLLFMTTFGGAIITAPQIANAATHVLTGAQTTTQTVTTDTDSVVTVNTDNTFSVNATSGDALTISGAGSITYDDLGNNNTLSTTGAGGNGLSITSTGDNAGPPAENGSITVISGGTISGANDGIFATNAGTGGISITTTGNVSGGFAGIEVSNTNVLATGDVTVNANNVTGGVYGIETYNAGSGITTITTDGVVQGGTAGIYAASSLTQPIDITVNNGSEVRNTSQNPADLAIQTVSDGATTLTNNGTVTGTVIFGAGNDTFTNNGTWNTSGTSDFDGGNDTLTNSSTGTINTSGTTTVLGVDTVNNFGTIDMQNGIAGETTTFTNGGTGDFIVNDGSTLLVDTNIATQQSDVLNVDNVQIGTGPTDVGVNVVAGLGQPINSDGILVVQDTSSDPNAFTMTPFNGGLYSYYLDEHANENYYLQSAVRPEAVATGVLPILGSRTALSTLSNLHDRQRDENALSNDDESRKGVWGRVFGQSNDFNANDANDFGFNSRVWGVQAGLDLMASGDNLGNRKYAGLYIAYASASGDARQFDNKVANLDLNATTIGAYYTKYSSDNWYLDLVAQYSSLGGIHAKTATDDISPGGKSYALSLEAGKQFHPDSSIVREVQAQLIDQYTDMDNVTLDDGTHVNVSGLNAVTGRFGLRLYGNPKGGKSFLPWFRANIWHTFSGDSTISSLGSSINTPIGGTSGELELGFTKGNSQSGGWGFYGSAGYLFDISGAEYSGWKGTLGLRKGW